MTRKNSFYSSKQYRVINYFIIGSAILFNTSINAQSISNLTGTVKGVNDSLLMGNALLLTTSDSSLIKGAFYMDGKFEINYTNEDEAILKLTSMGYRDTTISLQNISTNYDIGAIYLKEDSHVLDEVSVTATTPIIEQSIDGVTTANVENTILSSSATPFEVLSKLPNLIVDEEGVSVVGKGDALIYLDGKRVSISQISSMQVSQISKVAIINNPSAKYDAQGNAVINIISVVNNMEGFQGKAMQSVSLATHPQSNTTFNLNWRKGKWSIATDYGVDFGTGWGSNLLIREVLVDDQYSKLVNDYEHNNKSKYSATYRLGTKYQINDKSNITLEYIGGGNRNEQDSKATTVYTDPYAFETTIKAETSGELSNSSNALNINYINNLDTLGSKLFIGAQYSAFSSDDESFIDEVIESDLGTYSANRLNNSNSNINFITTQFDVEKRYFSGLNLDYGAKFTHANNTGKVDFYSKELDDTEFTHVSDLSNDFEYSENIPAAYFQFSNEFKNKFNVELGLRTEYTDAEGYSNSLSQTVIDTTYLNFFPNASIQMPLNDKMKFGLSYSSSINRPSYQALDPFLYYVDTLTSRQGNPELRPEYGHSIESSISYKRYSFKVGYTYAIDAFRYAMVEGDNGSNSTILKQLNVQSEHSYFTSLNIPLNLRKFRSFNVVGVTLDKIQDDRPEFQTDEFIPRVYLYSKNSLAIDKIGKLELNAQYLGTRFDGIYYRKPAYTVSMGISRAFLDKKLNCTFLVNDLIRSFEVDGYYELASSKVSYLRKFDSYFYRLTMAYNFGKLKEVNYNSKNVGQDTDRRIRK